MIRWLGVIFLVAACDDAVMPVADDDEMAEAGAPDGFIDRLDAAADMPMILDASDDARLDLAGPDVEIECTSNRECVDVLGERARCVGTAEGNPDIEVASNNQCFADQSNMGFRLEEATVTAPGGLAVFLNRALNDGIAAGDLNLTAYIENVQAFVPADVGVTPHYAGWIFHTNNGSGPFAVPAVGHPTSRASAREVGCAPGGAVTCLEMISQPEDAQLAPGTLELWLPNPGFGNACDLQRLTLPVVIRIDVDRDADVATMTVTGVVSKPSARRLMIELPSRPIQSLKALFEDASIAPDVDTNGDGELDGWQLEFSGPASRVAVQGNLAGALDDNPCD